MTLPAGLSDSDITSQIIKIDGKTITIKTNYRSPLFLLLRVSDILRLNNKSRYKASYLSATSARVVIYLAATNAPMHV